MYRTRHCELRDSQCGAILLEPKRLYSKHAFLNTLPYQIFQLSRTKPKDASWKAKRWKQSKQTSRVQKGINIAR